MTGSANRHATDSAAHPSAMRFSRVGGVLRPFMATIAVFACAIWAAWPVGKSRMEAPPIAIAAAGPQEVGIVPLDTAVFRTPLWVAPPAPPAPPVAAAPPPPLKLQLIAILGDGGNGGHGGYRAALYDPDADKLVVVGPGDTIAGRIIERIGAADLSLRDNGLIRTLSLRTDGGTP